VPRTGAGGPGEGGKKPWGKGEVDGKIGLNLGGGGKAGRRKSDVGHEEHTRQKKIGLPKKEPDELSPED